MLPVFLLASILLGLAAALLWVSSSSGKATKRQRVRMQQSLMDYVKDSLLAAGIVLDTGTVVLVGGLAAALAIIISLQFNAWYGPLIILLALLAGNSMIRLRVARLRRGITVQMPGFLDQLNRDMSSGQGLDISLRRAVARLDNPLRGVMNRVLNRVSMGQDIDEGIHHEANLLKSFELELLATIVSVNLRHGGSVRNALDSYINMLRQDERNQRDLRAMTGETRVTAWVLGLVPVVVLGLMLISNRGFLDSMLESDGGRLALLIAVGLQISGVWALYQMLKFR